MRKTLLTLLVIPALLLSACSGVATGDALQSRSATGIAGFTHLTERAVVRFSFPLLRNVTGKPVRIEGLSVDHVSTNVKVLGFSAYRLTNQTHYIIASRDGQPPVPGVRLDKPKWQTSTHFTIAPHRTGDVVPMVIARWSVPHPVTPPEISGCRVQYRLSGATYQQSFPCDFLLGDLSKYPLGQ